MIFSEPCCAQLKECLESGEDRAFHRLGADGKGPLFLTAFSSQYETRGGEERQWFEVPVLFCPFCGRHLQTREAVERYMSGDSPGST